MNYQEAKIIEKEWLENIDLPDDFAGKQVNLLSYIHDEIDTPLFRQKKTLLGREINKRGGRSIGELDMWSVEETNLVCDLYLIQLKDYLSEKPILTLGQTREFLVRKLNKSNKAVRLKMHHISSILVNSDLPYLETFKPVPRVDIDFVDWKETEFIKDKLIKELDTKEFIDLLKTALSKSDYSFEISENDTFEESPEPEIFEDNKTSSQNTIRIRPKINYVEREIRNSKLGEAGEEWVIEFEKRRLKNIGREDLIDKVIWASKEIGDGLGYDIISCDKDGNELYIEVKTTCLGKYAVFYLTEREIKTAAELGNNYLIYRVFDFNKETKIYKVENNIQEVLNLFPSTYRATIKKTNA